MVLENLTRLIRKIVREELEPIKKKLEDLEQKYEALYTNLEVTKKESREKIDRALKRIYDLSERVSRLEEGLTEKVEKEEEVQKIELPVPDFGSIKPQLVSEIPQPKKVSTEAAPREEEKIEIIEEGPIVIGEETEEISEEAETRENEEQKSEEIATDIVDTLSSPEAQEETTVKPEATPQEETPKETNWVDDLKKLSTPELYDKFAELNMKREEIESEISRLNLAQVAGELSDEEKLRIDALERELQRITEMIGAIAQILNDRNE